ncbi:unnamed protein product [Schistocephalus solidus]|uniref:Uncharacterized protein n=1 Tax=Schistocephalus solidus TaxID=70667 RepID=A0A183T4P3_SCHSO|nr:unnamed protein product [Schistocephalus solidus]
MYQSTFQASLPTNDGIWQWLMQRYGLCLRRASVAARSRDQRRHHLLISPSSAKPCVLGPHNVCRTLLADSLLEPPASWHYPLEANQTASVH